MNEANRMIPSMKTDLNINKHKYSELLEESQKIKKTNSIINEKMYNEIIEYGNQIKILEERKEKLKNAKKEQIENINKIEKIKEMEKTIKMLKKEKDIIDSENNEYEVLINDFVTHLNLNYINLINLKEQIEPINQNESKIEKYISNKNSQCNIIEQQIENIMNKYY
jgi:hypothetical protein